MLAIISPAKKLDFESDPITEAHTQPDLMKDAKVLSKRAKQLTRSDLKSMMHISDNLAELNYQRFQDFKPPFNLANARQAALTFAGDTYVGLDASTLKDKDLEYAQDHLRILSGLYGLLRPLDLIQPYRLEMGVKFAIDGKETLYDFWDDRVTKAINKATKDHKDRRVINLAVERVCKGHQTKDPGWPDCDPGIQRNQRWRGPYAWPLCKARTRHDGALHGHQSR